MGLRVVVVDDQAGFLAEARALLIDEGYDVVGEAVDGRSAVEIVEVTRPDVVLLDVQLPDINGFEVATRLAQSTPEVQVVLVSSRDASDYLGRLASSTARGFIPKAELSGQSLAAVLESAF